MVRIAESLLALVTATDVPTAIAMPFVFLASKLTDHEYFIPAVVERLHYKHAGGRQLLAGDQALEFPASFVAEFAPGMITPGPNPMPGVPPLRMSAKALRPTFPVYLVSHGLGFFLDSFITNRPFRQLSLTSTLSKTSDRTSSVCP